MGFKTKLGIVGVVLGGAVVVAMPGISGVIATQAAERELPSLVETYGYTVQELSFDCGFSSTRVNVELVGEGLKALNQESVTISGELTHGGISLFPTMVSGDLDVSMQQGLGEEPFSLTGDLVADVSWFGREKGEFTLAPVVLPIDSEAGAVVALDEYTVSFDSENRVADTYSLDVSQASLRVAESGYEVLGVEVAPSTVSFTPEAHEWRLKTPEVVLNIPRQNGSVTIEDAVMGGADETVGDLVSSHGLFETGKIYLSPEGKPLLESIQARTSLDNISLSALGELFELVDRSDMAQPEDAEKIIINLLKGLPRYSLDQLNIDTGRGSIDISFDVAATEKTAPAVQGLLDNPPVTGVEEYFAVQKVMNNIRSKARIQVTEPLIGWGCEVVSAQQTRDPVQLQIMAGGCKGLIESGQFLNMVCVDKGWECAEKMEEVREIWEKDRSLEVVLDEGEMTLNSVEFETQGMF